MAKLTILGSGTSTGVPTIGCTCKVCKSTDSKDQRLRTSALYQEGDIRVLFDCGPDFRAQVLPLPFTPLNAVLITHEHYDHVGGLDDLRSFSSFGELPVYAEEYTAKRLMERMPYCFVDKSYPGIPQLRLKGITAFNPFHIGGVQVVPIRVFHGNLPILGYRIGGLAYITDMLTAPDDTIQELQNIEVLVVNALRPESHRTHQNIEQALQFARAVKAKRTYLVHMSHDIGYHIDAQRKLPENIYFAYDGLEIKI